MSAKKHIDPDELRRLWATDLTIREIAAHFSISTTTLCKALRENDLHPRGCGKSERTRKKFSEVRRHKVDMDAVRKYASEGMSTREIGAILGHSDEVIRERMVEAGIPRLPAKARMEKNYFWNGGRMIDADGYILLKSPDHPYRTAGGYVREHRLVMEQKLGRYLVPGEVVHHIDSDKQNNHPDNLEIFESNGRHLAETLKGQCPKWTEDGLRRLRESYQRGLAKYTASRRALKSDVRAQRE